MPTSSMPNLLGVTDEFLQKLENACAIHDGAALSLHGPDNTQLVDIARHTATKDVTPSWANPQLEPVDPLIDIHIHYPTSATWSVDEVEKHIVAPAHLQPISRTHIVIPDAHKMRPAAADKLLKLIEEPHPNILYWFCSPHPTDLQTTLRARITDHFTLTAPPQEYQHTQLKKAGIPPETLPSLLAAANNNYRLALTAATHNATQELATYAELQNHFQTPTPTPVQHAEATLTAIANLAYHLSGRKSRGRTPTTFQAAWKRLDTIGRAHARSLLTSAITHGMREKQYDLPTPLTAHNLRAHDNFLRTCSTARSHIALNNAPLPELVNILTATPPTPGLDV